MSDKDLRQQILVNSQSILVRHLLENASLANLSNNSLFHTNPIINTLLANAFCQIALRKVDKSTQTLLRIPTKPNFYIRRGVLKNDVYTVRQRAEPEKPVVVASSSGVCPRRRRRRSSSHDSYKHRSRKYSRHSRRRSRTRSSTRSRSRTRSSSRGKSHSHKDDRNGKSVSTQPVSSKKKRKSKRNKRRKLKRKMSQIRHDDKGYSDSRGNNNLKSPEENHSKLPNFHHDQADQIQNQDYKSAVLSNSTPPKRKFPKCLPPSTSSGGSNLPSESLNSHGSSVREKKSSPDAKRSKSRSSSHQSESSCRSRRSRSYSRSSTSRSWSTCSSRSDSRSRSRSNSSKSRSPSYRNRRRITSARKRPIPYKRKSNYDHYISSGHSSSE